MCEDWRVIFEGSSEFEEDALAEEAGAQKTAGSDEDEVDEADKYWQEVNRSLCEQAEWWEMADDEDSARWEREEVCHYTCGEIDVSVVQQGWRGIAFRVWEAALVLCDFMVATGMVRGRKVLDLGSGPGLTGLVASALGATRVIVTDLPEVTELIGLNVKRYQKQRGAEEGCTAVQAVTYDWSQP